MTIEIQRPELEALIHERMKSGAFQNVEDVLMQALKASPAPDEKGAGRSDEKASATGAELVETLTWPGQRDDRGSALILCCRVGSLWMRQLRLV